MLASPILLQKKYARIIQRFAAIADIDLDQALDFFYKSQTYELISQGIADMHCLSDEYLAEDLKNEFLS